MKIHLSIDYDIPYQPPAGGMGEKRLWCEAMLLALEDYRDGLMAVATGKSPNGNQLDARRWFASDRAGIGSFLWLCRLVDMDPERVRATLPGPDPWSNARGMGRARSTRRFKWRQAE